MGARSSGREAALQMLFAVDTGKRSGTEVTSEFWREMPGEVEGRVYADPLVVEAHAKRELIDGHITRAAQNWRLARMAPVDRNILRVATCELLFRPDVPTEVIIDEAIELAKRYSADNSPAFVNGVLDKLARSHRPPNAD